LLAGVPGQPSTVPLFGGRSMLNDYRSGVRVEAGMWFDHEHTFGAMARFYTLFSARENVLARGNGTNVLNVPQIVNVNGVLTQIPVFAGFPGVTTGTATGGARSTFTGGDLSARLLLHREPAYRLEVLAGYRQMYLGDALSLNADVSVTGVPAALTTRNSVSSRNDFYGPQLGVLLSTGRGRLSLEAHASAALGATVSDLDFVRTNALDGSVNVPATTAALVGAGVPLATAAPLAAQLAAATNNVALGSTTLANTVTYFGAVAEVGLRAKWQVASNVRVSAGYGFIYWNNVRRGPEAFNGGDVLRLRASDFSTHTFTFGAEFRY
jgi:Putative beta barrel porin-7 (BBP7)